MRECWKRLDILGDWRPEHSTTPNPDLLAPPRWNRLGYAFALGLAAAAVLVGAFLALRPAGVQQPRAAPGPVHAVVERTLADGSAMEMNRGAAATLHFTAAERRVRLERGEAYFTVVEDPSRPFVVDAGNLAIRALGTAFNVRVDDDNVEILVTEGRVRVDRIEAEDSGSGPESGRPAATPLVPRLEARQLAVFPLAPGRVPPPIKTLTVGDVGRVLAWQHRLLDFTAAPLADVVAEFNRRNAVQLVIADPGLASMRVSASFRSDNVDGFVSLLEAGFGVRVERRSPLEIRLQR